MSINHPIGGPGVGSCLPDEGLKPSLFQSQLRHGAQGAESWRGGASGATRQHGRQGPVAGSPGWGGRVFLRLTLSFVR